MVKKLFRVEVREIHIQGYLAIADTEEEAINLVSSGEDDGVLVIMDEAHFEYSHTLDKEHTTAQVESPESEGYRHVTARCPRCEEDNNYRDGSDPEFAICNRCGFVWNFVQVYQVHSKVLSGLYDVMSKYNRRTLNYTLVGETLNGMDEFVTVGDYTWLNVSQLLDNFQNELEDGSYFQVHVLVEDLNGDEDEQVDWENVYQQGMEQL